MLGLWRSEIRILTRTESEIILARESSCVVWGTDIVSGCAAFARVSDGALSDALIFQARDSKIGAAISTVSFPISRFMGFFFLWVSCGRVGYLQVR